MNDNDVNIQNPNSSTISFSFVLQTERFGETAENLSERDLVTSDLVGFPALGGRELQTLEHQIWCFVPHLI